MYLDELSSFKAMGNLLTCHVGFKHLLPGSSASFVLASVSRRAGGGSWERNNMCVKPDHHWEQSLPTTNLQVTSGLLHLLVFTMTVHLCPLSALVLLRMLGQILLL